MHFVIVGTVSLRHLSHSWRFKQLRVHKEDSGTENVTSRFSFFYMSPPLPAHKLRCSCFSALVDSRRERGVRTHERTLEYRRDTRDIKTKLRETCGAVLYKANNGLA